MKKLITLVLAVSLGCQASRAQEMPVTATARGQELFRQARQFHQLGWFEKADDLFREVLAAEPQLAMAHAYVSVLDHLLYRDPEPRMARARELAEELPAPEKQMVESLVQYAGGDYEGAIVALQNVLEAYPGDPYARHRLGAAQVSAGRPAQGVETLQELLEKHPNYPGAWNHLGYGLMALDRLPEALDAFRNFIAAFPGNPNAHHSYADALEKAGQTDSAIVQIIRAVLLEPRLAYGWLHLAVILQQQGALQEALAALDRAEQSSELYGPLFRQAVQRRRAEINEEGN